jgi:hypothetical protein
VRNEIAELTGRLIPRFNPDEWHTLAQDLLDAAEFDQLMTNPDVDPAAWFEEVERRTVIPGPSSRRIRAGSWSNPHSALR